MWGGGEGLAPSIPLFFVGMVPNFVVFWYLKAWSSMTSLLHCYLHEINAFIHQALFQLDKGEGEGASIAPFGWENLFQMFQGLALGYNLSPLLRKKDAQHESGGCAIYRGLAS